ncbi:MAG TPA: hypothetical protein VFG87_15305 [Amycolatopsis sp.]|jgi:hypothetical protein|nr:hypothetical protein [Amycolatopsis sp.]
MPDELTLAALQTLADLKRQGVIPTTRPCCGHDYCQCPDAPQPASLRDHAADHDAYDQAIGAPTRLHIVTAGPPVGPPCDGTYTCPCPSCRGNVTTITPKGAGPAAFRVIRRAA